MNICLFLLSDGWGGAETVVYELAKHLRDKGETVSIALNQEIIQYYTDLENIKIFSFGSFYPQKKTSDDLFFKAYSLLHSYLRELFRYRYYKGIQEEVMRFLSDNNIEVIHSHMPGAILLVSNLNDCKIPKIATCHGEHTLREKKTINLLRKPLIKWQARKFKRALDKTDKITFVSTYMLNSFRAWGVPLKDKSTVIYNGINLPDIKNSLSPAVELKGKFNLLFPGGAKTGKGGDLLINILPKLKQEIPDIHLYIARDVPQNHLLRKIVVDLGLKQNVTFTGFLSIKEYRDLLNSVDVMVMPSFEEAFGIVYIEAMALGKPVVGTNTGGVPEVVKNGRNGILMELNPNRVADAILCLYRNEDLRRRIGKNNLEDAKKFDWNNSTDQYINLYKETIKC